MSLGAVLDVSKGGKHVATLTPSEGFYDSGEPGQGSVGHLIGGQAVSHVSMDGGVTRDVWSAIAPDISTPRLSRVMSIANKTIPLVRPDEGMIALAVLVREYLKAPPPAQFHLIVSPLVLWIWIGGLIVIGGALIAAWPAPSAIRRRVRVGLRSTEDRRDRAPASPERGLARV
jgi:cytochrome c-type biogenesis protein CcmF